ncbi:hypothetical protein FCH28_11355 [Streptomyces piniterrae]|uniref:Uncharacterized protein n=1 Tax=Streptomyces piniterrae TaxID=2571125 RepID=A0A4U0NZQ6_9ACTN|nr:hypothetical protein [Streptomyces piniterrae]TJZ55874.1 hypothetical protein FCH28_11355 [Streptomyces piniterrae]
MNKRINKAEAKKEFDAARQNHLKNLGQTEAVKRLNRAEDVYRAALRGDNDVRDSRPGGGWLQ